MEDLGLDGVEHTRLAALDLQAENSAELTVKLHYAHGRQADVLHMIEVGIESLGEVAQAEGFSHTGPRGENADAPGVLQVIQTVHHLLKVVGQEAVLFLYLLLVKGVERQAVVAQKCHLRSPPSLA